MLLSEFDFSKLSFKRVPFSAGSIYDYGIVVMYNGVEGFEINFNTTVTGNSSNITIVHTPEFQMFNKYFERHLYEFVNSDEYYSEFTDTGILQHYMLNDRFTANSPIARRMKQCIGAGDITLNIKRKLIIYEGYSQQYWLLDRVSM